MSSLKLRLDDETTHIYIAVDLRLRIHFCCPECSHCGSKFDDLVTHGFSCWWSEGRYPRHVAVNGIIQGALNSAKIFSQLEPAGLSRADGQFLDRSSIIPWKSGKALVWDATCPDIYPPSHVYKAAGERGWCSGLSCRQSIWNTCTLESSHHYICVFCSRDIGCICSSCCGLHPIK